MFSIIYPYYSRPHHHQYGPSHLKLHSTIHRRRHPSSRINDYLLLSSLIFSNSSTTKTRHVFPPHQQQQQQQQLPSCDDLLLYSLDLTNPSSYQSYASILHSCRKLHLPHHLGFQIHAHMVVSGVDFLCQSAAADDVFLASQLLEFYCKFGSIRDARLLFDRMTLRDVFCWTSLLGMYCDSGHFQETIDLFYTLIGDQKGSGERVRPDHFVFPKVFKACAELKNFRVGKDVYDYMISIGFEGNNCVKRSYLDMFVKCGKVDVAWRLFRWMGSKDVVMWNIMVSGYIAKRDFKRALKCVGDMELAGVLPDRVTWNTILAGHAQVGQFSKASKYLSDIGGSGDLEPNVVSWTALITGNVQNGLSSRSLGIFRKMVLAGIKPNSTTITSVISACTNLSLLRPGKEIHGYCIKTAELDSDLFVGNSLVDFYFKCEKMDYALIKFNGIEQRDLVSWNAVLAGFANRGCREDAINLLHDMKMQGVRPDIITWNGLITGFTQYGDGKTAREFFCRMCCSGMSANATSLSGVLAACAQISDLKFGKEIHGYILRNQVEVSTGVGSALISMYAGCGSLEVAYSVFNELHDKDVVIWNSMISACARSGFGIGALNLLRELNLTTVKPDSVTLVSALPACSRLAALRQGKEIHQYIIRHGLNSSNFLMNALIDMYGRCGSISKSRLVFEMILQRDVVSWNVMIAVYGMHGFGMDAVNLFLHMRAMGVKPNNFTFTNLLSACSHSGLMDEGWKHFKIMKEEYDLDPEMEHYACIVDLMARAGKFIETLEFMEKMPFEPNAVIWGSLLGACRIYCNPEMAEYAAGYLLELEPQSSGHYILLANIYSTVGRWEDAAKIRCLMKERGVIKLPGCSWIEVGRKVYSFIAGDTVQPLMEKLMTKIETLYSEIKEMGFVPNTKFVLQNVEEAEKEFSLCGHSEKLALAFGLISTRAGTPLRIIKNLRVCGDCHSAIKYISKLENREITMRDNYRFHHFVNGVCSCGDYW